MGPLGRRRLRETQFENVHNFVKKWQFFFYIVCLWIALVFSTGIWYN